jgi:AraC family transcriptional regulator, transcriptional activator of pobA
MAEREFAEETDDRRGSWGPLRVRHVRWAKMPSHAGASHVDHGLHYLVGGRTRLAHGTTLEAAAGSVLVMPAGMPHRPLEGHAMESWLLGFCAACFDLDESQTLMKVFARVRSGALPIVEIPDARRDRLKTLFVELAEECGRAGPESPELVSSLVRLILGEIYRAMPMNETLEPTGSLVGDALETIQRRCLEPISLEHVAAAVHRTPAHVADAVKKATGHTVGAWINAGRIAEASMRLIHTDDSLQEIAAQVGWNDVTHFIRQFRKARGTTPAAWRRENRRHHRETASARARPKP